MVTACAGHPEILSKSCKYQNKDYFLKEEFKGGARSRKSIQDTILQKQLGVAIHMLSRSLHQNNMPERKYKLVFNIYISSTGEVMDIETAYSNLESCELLKRIYKYYSDLNFGEIDDKNDISIFQQRIDFYHAPSKLKDNSKTRTIDDTPSPLHF